MQLFENDLSLSNDVTSDLFNLNALSMNDADTLDLNELENDETDLSARWARLAKKAAKKKSKKDQDDDLVSFIEDVELASKAECAAKAKEMVTKVFQTAFDKNMTADQKKAAITAVKNKYVPWLKANCQKTMNADEDLSFFEDDLTELTTYIIRRRTTPRVVYVRHDEDESTELKETW